MHTEEAKEIAVYGKDFYVNTPGITENEFKEGKACYAGTDSEQKFVKSNLYYSNSMDKE